ncbi:Putative SOS response-associated peptidase YedK [Algoriphagus alkaliphilus]|uniref:Abasic site processing protein n=2 Tax=Algoriphagus TaxID=246875 RepID=A0A1G5XHG1_9BACT|nr:SOS response-associated peptidase [Algoriphagus alkaliphilus]MBA4302264.1 SOS response-associated peptidase [Cyclobacterium sp.]SDA69863.1 Putative SOS response-associated peptidase YedK [Algoriphagus alkaliphilus]
MCGRYSLSKSKIELEERFQADMVVDFTPRYNIAPTQLVPVITSDSPRGFSFFYWGITPDFGQNKPVSQKLINARAESVNEKISFRNSFQKRRCLVPADGFFEWKRLGKKTKIPYRFTLRDEDMFAFAGIWEEYETVSGESQHTFLILTTTPNEVVSEVHDRMPVIISRDQEKKWLDKYTSEADLLKMLNTYPGELMMSYTVSPLVNSVHNDVPGIIRKTSPMDQFGNYTLFG